MSLDVPQRVTVQVVVWQVDDVLLDISDVQQATVPQFDHFPVSLVLRVVL